MSKKVGERRQPCLTPMVVRRKGRLHWWLCYWAACGTARLENELSREKRQNGGLTTQKVLLLPTIGRQLVWLSSGEDGSFPKGKNSEKNSVDIHENSFGFCSLIIPVNFTRDYPCLFSSVFFFRRTFCPFCYPMSFHFSSLRSSNTLNTSAVTQDFLTALRLPRISLAVSVTAAMKVLIGVSTSMLSTSSVVGDANPPPIITWKATTSSRSLSTHFYLL